MDTRGDWKKLMRPMGELAMLVRGGGSSKAAPEKVLRGIATLMLSQAQRAFREQKLGSKTWPARYPNQGPPKMNIAGALTDLAKGSNILPRRFEDRPALQDTTTLKRSLTPKTGYISMLGMFVVEVGTTVAYAGVHQWGGQSRISVTQTMRDNYFRWKERQMGGVRSEFKNVRRGRSTAGDAKREARTEKRQAKAAQVWAAEKFLEPILKREVYVVKVNPRPFLGWTDDLGRKTADFIAGKIGGA